MPKAVVEWNGSQTALRTFRKHASWYLTGFAVGKDIRREIQQINSLDDLTSIIDILTQSYLYP